VRSQMRAFIAQHMCTFVPPVPHSEHSSRQVLIQVLADYIFCQIESHIQLPNAFILIHGPRHGQVNMAIHQGRQNSCII